MQCTLCPLSCGADRSVRAGACGVRGLTVAKSCLHAYEEPCLSPNNRSGTVFFGGCSLQCVFCQNFEVSRARRGRAVTPQELSAIFLSLEEAGAENIDLVTPDHVSDLVAEALSLRKPRVPVIYNSGGYCRTDALERIEPYIDIWMPDLKFYSPDLSERYTRRRDYFEYASRAVAFMARKSAVWQEGRLLSGLLVRHLVLPSCTSDSLHVLDFLHRVLPPRTPLSLMRQYTPMGNVQGFPELCRTLTSREYRRVTEYALSLGFGMLYTQDKDSIGESFIPDWDG